LLGFERADSYQLSLAAEERGDVFDTIDVGALSIGNPHAIVWVESVERAPVELVGPRIEGHTRFPSRVNVGFAEIVSGGQLNLRVYERGVGETQACGTGACAAAVYGIQTGKLESPVTVVLPGGKLEIEWRGEGEQVIMTGPASFVYDAELLDNGPECD
jgi:diaminopimelate epimerase